jgi:hypothetical protein
MKDLKNKLASGGIWKNSDGDIAYYDFECAYDGDSPYRFEPYDDLGESRNLEGYAWDRPDWERVITIKDIMSFMAGSSRALRIQHDSAGWKINMGIDEFLMMPERLIQAEWCETNGPDAWVPKRFTRKEMNLDSSI